MEKNQTKIFKALLMLILMLIDTVLLVLFVYFNHAANDLKDDGVAYVSIQQESSPFDNKKEDYIELHDELAQRLKYHEFYSQPLFNWNNSRSFYEAYTGVLEKGCEEISSSQIGQTLSDRLVISQGRNFADSDFVLSEKNIIPVILGNDYENVYNIGDTFELEYLYDIYKFEVIGILEKNSRLSLNMEYFFDKSIIMPFFTVPLDSELTDGEIIHYANYTSGVVEIPSNEFSADMNVIKQILSSTSCGRYSYAIQQQNYFWKDFCGLYPKSLRNIIAVFLIVVSILLLNAIVSISIPFKRNIFLCILALLTNSILYFFLLRQGFGIGMVYYMIIPIVYFSGVLIKRILIRSGKLVVEC